MNLIIQSISERQLAAHNRRKAKILEAETVEENSEKHKEIMKEIDLLGRLFTNLSRQINMLISDYRGYIESLTG